MTTQADREKILIVDDQPEDIWPLSQHLQPVFDVLCVASGQEALEIVFSENRPDIILLDIMMPDMDGFEVCSRLKANAETWSIPVIFITALGQEVDVTRGLNLGAVDFITKPFSIPVAKARIEAHLRLKEEMDSRITLAHKLEELNRNLKARIQKKSVALEQAHDIYLARKVSDRVYVLDRGRMVEQGAAFEVFGRPAGARPLDLPAPATFNFGIKSAIQG